MEENIMMKPCKLLIIAGSAGGLEVLLDMLPVLKPGFSFAVLILLHRGSQGEDSALAELLAMKTEVPVKEVEDKEQVLEGMIYMAPKDYHLLCEDQQVFALDASEKVNFSRPSIDVTFESAAEVYGESLTVILLSGGNMDGTQGIGYVKKYGGVAVVQHPATAKVSIMPENAISNQVVDHVYTPDELIFFINGINRE